MPLGNAGNVKWIFDNKVYRFDSWNCNGDTVELKPCNLKISILRAENHVIKDLGDNTYEWTFVITDSMYLATKPIE